MQIQIIKVDGPVNIKRGKGNWNELEVAYKNISNSNKVEGKKLVDFKNKEVFKVVSNAKEGETYDITTEKDESNYWQWVGIVAADGSVPESDSKGPERAESRDVSKAAPAKSGVQAGKWVPDELRQKYIVRQSSINAAVQLLIHNNPKGAVEVESVLSVAKEFEKHVFGGIKEMADDIPF